MKAYYEDSKVTLYHGNCLEIMPRLRPDMFDAVITDPPYGTTQNKWDGVIPLEPMWANLHNVCKDDGAIVLFGAEPFSSTLRLSNCKNYKYDWVWDKVSKDNFLNARKQPLRQTEDIAVFYRKQCTYNPQMTVVGLPRTKSSSGGLGDGNSCYGTFGKVSSYNNEYYPSNIITVSNAVRTTGNHPTQKPVELMEYLIKTYTNEGDAILDFACGSGTTGVAAKNLNRTCVMIELEEKYCEIAANRLIAADNRTPDLGL